MQNINFTDDINIHTLIQPSTDFVLKAVKLLCCSSREQYLALEKSFR